MSILDSILNQSARVVSSQHDVNQITIEAGAVASAMAQLTRGRTWDAREYGITQAQAEAEIAAANTPEARERVLTNLRTRAIRRAQLDTSNGKVNAFFAGQPAWHGLGVVVDQAATSAEAIKFAGLDWLVEKVQNTYTWGGLTHNSPDAYSIIRSDTGAHLGTVGAKYKPVQNVEGFAFLDGVLGAIGARYETAGSLFGGKRVWMLAHLPQSSFSVQVDDRTECYVLFSNCHDGSGAAWCYPTTVRVECANTLRIASVGRGAGLSIRHTGNVADKISSARESLGLACEALEGYKANAEAMVTRRVDAKAYAASVLEAAMGVSEEQARLGADALADAMDATEAEREKLAKKIEKRNTALEDILERYETARCRPAGSVWAAFNALTEHADHAKQGREAKDAHTRNSRRFESILSGDSDALKQVAYTQAVAAIA